MAITDPMPAWQRADGLESQLHEAVTPWCVLYCHKERAANGEFPIYGTYTPTDGRLSIRGDTPADLKEVILERVREVWGEPDLGSDSNPF